MCLRSSVKETKTAFECNQVKIGSNGRKNPYICWKDLKKKNACIPNLITTYIFAWFVKADHWNQIKMEKGIKWFSSSFFCNQRDLLTKGTFPTLTWGKVGLTTGSYANF